MLPSKLLAHLTLSPTTEEAWCFLLPAKISPMLSPASQHPQGRTLIVFIAVFSSLVPHEPPPCAMQWEPGLCAFRALVKTEANYL